jgi:hypothetical protein
MESARRVSLRLALASAIASAPCVAVFAADTEDAVDITVKDATAKVGEPAYVLARIAPRAGFEIAGNYRNRVGQFSAAGNGVEFGDKFVRGTLEGGALLFKVPVVPKRPGPNAINGVVRFAFVSESDGQRHLDIKTVPLMATVTGAP